MNLTALQHSPFLQSLGWAIANSLWQAAALWIAYLLINGMYKNASAKFKNNLSTILLSTAFVWFCITLFTKYFAIADITRIYQAEYYTESAGTTAKFNWNDLLNKFAAVLPYLSVAYLILLVFLSFRLIKVYTFTRFIKSNGLQKPAVEWRLFAEKVARHMGITRKIKLWVSQHIDVPATIGFIKPVILIPLASVNQLSTDQLEAIILHELSHIKRNDYLINLFISIVETILFFNPFVVLLAKIIKRERENCCDDFVIQYQYDRHAYASALLSLEQFRNMNLRLAIGSTSGKKQLLLRVKRIMEINSNTNFNYGQKLAALFLITGVICSVAWLSPHNNENKKLQVTKKDKNYNKKTENIPGLETIFFKQPDKTGTAIPVKLSLKKQLTRTEWQLRELKNLNLKQIAEMESNRWNLLLQQSRKAINNQWEKLSRNKFFIARRGIGGPALFTANGTTMLPYKELTAQQAYTAADLQNFQTQMDNVQFNFSLDFDKMQNVVKDYDNMQLFDQKELMLLEKKLKDAVIDKVKVETTRPGSKPVRMVRPGTTIVTSTGGSTARTFFVADSMAAEELRLVYRSRSTQGKVQGGKALTATENKNAPEPRPSANWYAYGYTTKEARNKNTNVVKVSPGSTVVYERQAPVTPEVTERRYRSAVPVRDDNSPKIYLQRSMTPSKSVRVECKNGVVYLNGRLIELPETKELVAQVMLKGKRITSKIKNIDIEVND